MRSQDAFQQRANMAGLSIIELMVAMALSLLLLIGVLELFSSSRSSFETNDRIARLQENGRFALNLIANDVRASGYQGCRSTLPGELVTTTTLNQPAGLTAISAYTDYSVTGYNYSSAGLWTPVLSTAVATSPANGSDVLLLRQPVRGSQQVELTATMTAPTDDLQIAPIVGGSGPFTNNQVVMIADCKHRSVFEITSYTPATGIIKHELLATSAGSLGNATTNLGQLYGGTTDSNPAQLTSFQTVIYYVRSGINGNGLWRRVGLGAAEELIEGVDSMQLLFGVDTSNPRDGSADDYVSPNNVVDPEDIVAVSIALLIRSVDQYGTIDADSKTYDLLDTTFTAPGDRRLRQTFTTTATIRNFAK